MKQDLKNHRDFGKNKVRPEQYKIAHTLLHIATTIFKYGVEIWGNTYESPLQNICTMQNRAIRIIHNIWYREDTNTFFLNYKVQFPFEHPLFLRYRSFC